MSNLPASTKTEQVDVTFASQTKTNINQSGVLDRFTVILPADARGPISLQVSAKNDNTCVVASGMVSAVIVANELYSLTVSLQGTASPICAGGAPVTITVNKMGGGGGNITATPSSSSCGRECTSQMAQLDPGTVVSLDVDTLVTAPSWTSTFDGWSGACTGTTTCFISVAQAATATAHFTCHGWCPETPANETNNLNAIWGFSATRVIAVGDNETILQGDGTSWKRVTSNVTAPQNLRGVHGVSGGVGYAVGTAGTIVKTTDSGSTWTAQTSTTTRDLRGVFTFDGSDTFAVRDNISAGVTWLRGDGMSWATINHSGVDYNWNALWGLSSPNFYVVGEMGRTVINNPFNIPSPASTNALYGVYGTSSTTMTAVGVGKTLLRLNGTTWMAMTPPTGTGFPVLRAIHGTAAATPIMYTVGDSGTVWFFDGTTWSVEAFPVQTQLNGVFVFSTTELYVVGQGGLIYHKKP